MMDDDTLKCFVRGEIQLVYASPESLLCSRCSTEHLTAKVNGVC